MLVLDNPLLRDPSWVNLWRIFVSAPGSLYTPLVHVTFWLQERVGWQSAAAYHAGNVALHAVNAGLVYLMSRKLGFLTGSALLIACLFASHPLQTEAVAWISARKDLLAAFFMLLTLLTYERHDKIALALFICACLAKPSAAALVGVLYVWYRGARLKPYLLAAAAISILTIAVHMSVRTIALRHEGLLDRVCAPAYGLLFYLVKCFVPVRLSALYPDPVTSGFIPSLLYVGSPLILLVLAAGVYRLTRHLNRAGAGVALFAILLIPVLQIFPTRPLSLVSDRYVYLPIVGIFAAAIALWSRLSVRPILNAGLAAALVLSCTVLTSARIPVWQNGLTLWEDVISKYPGIVHAYHNRGNEYARAGRLDEAIADFTRATEIYGNYAWSYHNRALAYRLQNRWDEALTDHTRAVNLIPEISEFRLARAKTLFQMGRLSEAANDTEALIRLEPENLGHRLNLAYLYELLGLPEQAVAVYRSAARLDPNNADTYYGLGNAHAALGEWEEATQAYTRAVALNPKHADAYNNRGNIKGILQKPEGAIADFNKAIEAVPTHADALNNLGYEYLMQKDWLKASEYLHRALNADPAHAFAKENLKRLPQKFLKHS